MAIAIATAREGESAAGKVGRERERDGVEEEERQSDPRADPYQ